MGVWRAQRHAEWELVARLSGADAEFGGVVADTSGPLIIAGGAVSENARYQEYSDLRPAVWTSPDGVDWQRHELAGGSGIVTALAYGLGGYVAAGEIELCQAGKATVGRPVIWTSTDGDKWSAPQVIGLAADHAVCGLDDYGFVTGLAASAAGFVAVGSGLWFSADGASWESREHDLLLMSGHYVAASEREFVIASLECPIDESECFLAAWRSTDGETWARASVSAQNVFYAPPVLAWLGDRFLLVAEQRLAATSPDGEIWTPIDRPPHHDEYGYRAYVTAIDGLAAVISSAGVAWLGPLDE